VNNFADELYPEALSLLEQLVSIDTTSAQSNLPAIDFIEGYLAEIGVKCQRVESACGNKANLIASVGPKDPGGVILSGHLDVVPVDNQEWDTDPFSLSVSSDRLIGRGTADMKGFIACALAASAYFLRNCDLKRPLLYALSYDEEVGCLGAPSMIDWIVSNLPRPGAAIVGEPTGMQVVSCHKGVSLFEVVVRGREAHSSLTHLGISANAIAVRLMSILIGIADELEHSADCDLPLIPPYPTITIGQINGGTAANILAGECRFVFDVRCPPGTAVDDILREFTEKVEATEQAVARAFPGAGVSVRPLANVPPLAPELDGPAAILARRISGDNVALRAVPFGSEAGQFQSAELSTIICGPGNIEQAHQPNEYIEADQMKRCLAFLCQLGAELSQSYGPRWP
jgi:acetylornithine deacetylase